MLLQVKHLQKHSRIFCVTLQKNMVATLPTWTGKESFGLGWAEMALLYNTAQQKFEHYNFDMTRPEAWEDRYKNTAYCFMQDPFNTNIMWIACYGSGIYWFDKKKKKVFKNFHAANKKDSCWINTKVTMLDAGKDSTIWYSTWGNGMGEYNTKTGSYKVYAAEGAFFGIENGIRQLFFGGVSRMIRSIVIDDEQHCIKSLVKDLEQHCSAVEIIEE